MPPSVSFADSPASPRAGIPLRKKSNSKAGRRSARPASIDPLSDRATQALIRRTLCPQRSADKGRDSQMPIDKLLPPLTSRNDVNLQLYAFLAIILREFVQSWYSKVTTDETFVGEILHIIAHCTQTLEERFRKLDLESLALNEIPELLEKHVTTYRTAHQSSVQPPLELDSREAYHALWPLPFLSPVPQPGDSLKAAEQRENEAIYRQLLVQAVLAVILPTAELENPCLTALVGQIFSELILGNAVGTKAVQPWLLYEGICILARLRDEKKVTSKQESTPVTGQTNLKISTRGRWSARGIFPAIVHLIFVFLSSIRLMAATIAMSTSLPPRTTPSEEIEDPNGPASTTADHVTATQSKVPVLASRAWTFLANLIELSSRMPWLAACFSLLQLGAVNGPGRIAASDSKLDRFLSHHIRSLFSPTLLPPTLRTLRGVLFPNNSLGSSSMQPPSSDAELRALRRRAARALSDLLPGGVARVYFCGRLTVRPGASGEDNEQIVDQVEQLLMVLDDEYCNKHLMYSVLELVLVRLMPELSDKGVIELWEERA